MSAPARLGLYAAILLTVFAVAYVTAGAFVPEETVQSWTEESNDHAGDRQVNHTGAQGAAAAGQALESNGYRRTDIATPTGAGQVPALLGLPGRR